ncbi:hypothetical protein [Aestuariimicrobium sp. T2.26MG-19.2B]|uniref:hypothetical protein n=1 Tax=Aestuariimicrobium sp. T2.26MG-19.2B TaxID=3040679 RepID=UPI0024776AFF|nr:hypothetical protein [Aestuariimicrobium sp. T2.26MG-19.2B]CAI9407901.1 hypothetical protein AESSP_01919 [Aestuariimicrobium sp. T2.26MG-19.2B]
MADPTQTIEVTLAEGYSTTKTYHGVPAIRSVLQRIDGLYGECKSKDHTEAQQGADAAACADRGDFEQKVNALVTETDGLLTAVWTTFTSSIETKSQTIDALMSKAKKWSQVGTTLDGYQTTIDKHLKADDWNSKGARTFKAALPTQQKAMYELEELCYRADTVITSSAAVNAGIFEAVYQSLVLVETAVKQAAGKPVKNLEFWSDSGSSDSSNGCVSFNYYQRTTTAKANFSALRTWLDSFITTRGEWSGSAQQVASDIPTVTSSVVNLKEGGAWPDPKAQVTGDANVDDQTGTSGTTHSSTSTSGGGGGIDLDNQGGIFG